MKPIIIVCFFLVFVISCDHKPSSPQKESQGLPAPKVIVEKVKTERVEPPSPEVKIKLKRDGKDHYSWELSGSDVNEILKVNERLRKQLAGDQQK